VAFFQGCGAGVSFLVIGSFSDETSCP
jgi:hypothetical protein